MRQEDRSVRFRHGGKSFNSPSQLPHCITVGQTPENWRLTDTPELFSVSLFFFILVFLITWEHLPFWVILDFTSVLLLECRTAWVFKRSLFKQQSNIMGEMWKNSHTTGGRQKSEEEKKKKRTFLSWRAPLKQITAVCNQGAEITKLLGHHSNQKLGQSSKLWAEQQLIESKGRYQERSWLIS